MYVFNLVLDFHYFKKINFLVCVSIKISFELRSILVFLLLLFFFFGGGSLYLKNCGLHLRAAS